MKTSDKNNKERDKELTDNILEQRREKKGKTKFEQDRDEPVIGEEKVETRGFNSGNESTPEGMGGEGQAAAAVPYEKKKKHQNGE